MRIADYNHVISVVLLSKQHHVPFSFDAKQITIKWFSLNYTRTLSMYNCSLASLFNCTEHSIKNNWQVWVEFWLGQLVPEENGCCEYNCWAYQVQNNCLLSLFKGKYKGNFFYFSSLWVTTVDAIYNSRCYSQLTQFIFRFWTGKASNVWKIEKKIIIIWSPQNHSNTIK